MERAAPRLQTLLGHLQTCVDAEQAAKGLAVNGTQASERAKRNTLTVTDNRTGKTIEIPIEHNTIQAERFKQFVEEDKDGEDGANTLKAPHPKQMMLFDPAFSNTACCKSSISYIDGDRGILRYRGYPIEELAEKSNFLEVAFLLINGQLPTKDQFDTWKNGIMTHTYLHENLTSLMKIFRYDAHPMGMVISSMAALSTFYPEANPALQGVDIFKKEQVRNKQIYRIIGKMPTIAACAYRHRIGRAYNEPQSHLSYCENLLYICLLYTSPSPRD
eukprot:TRINITY_DN5736_c0_g1_i2.p1 TRINITY_DN5736_c0_g1~~TRINITY_DN5736_c0_g1_i2.p1  ORF type:complete len:309 (+),score=81.08 TRINITY_DN5736_c0_g1_i2:107-928(+)